LNDALFLTGKPLLGLGPVVFDVGYTPLQQYNRLEPRATLEVGPPLDPTGLTKSWAAPYDFSWTEFTIDGDQDLTVWTFGIRYDGEKNKMDDSPGLLVRFSLPRPIPNGERCLRNIACQSSNCCLGTYRENACLLD
jgi:hypothetical protein